MAVKDFGRDALMVSVHDAMGGNGKLFFVATLAAILAQGSRRAVENNLSVAAIDVCVVEMSLNSSNYNSIAGAVRPHAGDLMKSGKKITVESVREHLVYNEINGYHTLVVPDLGDAGLSPKFYRKVLSVLRTMFDVVMISVESGENNFPLQTLALEASHISLLVTSLRKNQLESAGKWIEGLRGRTKKSARWFDHRNIHLIVNCVEADDFPSDDISVFDLVEESLPGIPVMDFIPSYAYDGVVETRAGVEFDFHTENMTYPRLHKLGVWFAKKVGNGDQVLSAPKNMKEFITEEGT